jgi:hypothetical protein
MRADKKKTITRKEENLGAKGRASGVVLKMPTVRTTGKNS